MNIALERKLRKNMSSANENIDFEPVEHDSIIVDSNLHEYWVSINGKLHKAFYIAFPNPFPTDEESVLCTYGLMDRSEFYTYLSHPEESAKIVGID